MTSPMPQPQPGDRLLVPCNGGPSTSRLVEYPPPLEIEDQGGLYVLDDRQGQHQLRYEWVPAAG